MFQISPTSKDNIQHNKLPINYLITIEVNLHSRQLWLLTLFVLSVTMGMNDFTTAHTTTNIMGTPTENSN